MITVLRLGHRRGRDDRISTHVGLTARQFGADGIIYSGEQDENMLASVRDVVERWGGPFDVDYREDWRPVIEAFDGTVAHLTMYGRDYREELPAVQDAVDGGRDVLVVVGGERVPSDVFDLAGYNLAVGHQPHSEVAALAVFLHDLSGGDELEQEFDDADIEVVPQADGKETRDPRHL
ncbi:MAG: tRNA (cytidine(56)-2'-O)-methyltransferase [Candidatus Nanohaloarchaea archaeon]|nr:tRNA (cytidine(56)-2'-O)-methyltransferase [Candidatus Nanohaloarchaea archaeon]